MPPLYNENIFKGEYMKKIILTAALLCVLSGWVFGQVSLKTIYTDWGATDKYIRTKYATKDLTESNMGTSHFISFPDELNSIPVKVDFIFDKKGNLAGRAISNQQNLKNGEQLYLIFKNEAVGKFGNKFASSTKHGTTTEVWRLSNNMTITILSAGQSVQYVIEKNTIAK
jgi:hypothetical protein